MTPNPGDNTDLITSLGVTALATIGGIAKGAQWRTATGEMSFSLLLSGIATALVMAAVVRAAGVHFGVEPWIQVAGSGVLCYVGPDPILRAVAGVALKRFGINPDGDSHADKK